MTIIQQHTGRHFSAADVIQADATVGVTRYQAIDKHHAGDLIHKLGQFPIAQCFRVYNQCVAALANQHLNGMTFFFRLMVAVANQDILLMLLGNHIHGFYQRAKKRI